MIAPAFNWSSFYIGGFVGGDGADRNAVSFEPCASATCMSFFTGGGLQARTPTLEFTPVSLASTTGSKSD